MKSTKLERSRMRRKVSRTVLKSSGEGRPSSLRQQHAQDTTEKDLKDIAEKSPIINLAYEELNKEHWSEKDLVAYDERIMDLYKEEAILEQKLEEGIEKGREEGRKTREIEMAKVMLADNIDVNAIVKFTGLSISEIEELRLS